MRDLSIFPVVDEDLPFLRTMLHAAAFWQDGIDAPSVDDALRQADLACYVDGWGRPGDRGLVARLDGQPVGAVWVRRFTDDEHGYGYVDEQTPELAIAIASGHRGRGIGHCLMTAMLAQARLDGIARLSLSVDQGNPARHLYDRLGFVPVGLVSDAVTMVRTLRAGP